MGLNSIAFIPDGNRRFALARGLSLFEAYSRGTDKALEVIKWLTSYPEIKAGTFYTLSLENAQRSKAELSVRMKIFEKELERVKTNSLFEEKGIKLKFVGKKEIFSRKVQSKMLEAEKITSENGKKTVYLALGYNGQEEIVEAAKKIALSSMQKNFSLKDLDRDSFKNFLYDTMPEPDMLIRTSGTKRLSGFLTYQSAYSELCFIDKYWPELQKQDLDNAISEYDSRKRKFGK